MPLMILAAGAAGGLVWFGKEAGEGTGSAIRNAALGVGVAAGAWFLWQRVKQ